MEKGEITEYDLSGISFKLKDTYQEKDASKISEHLAIQFNIQGEAEGALYLEIANGQLHVEPYEYYDRDILVTTSAADLLALAQGSLDILEAYQSGKISAEGNLAKALLLNEIVTGSSEAPSPAESAPVEASASDGICSCGSSGTGRICYCGNSSWRKYSGCKTIR